MKGPKVVAIRTSGGGPLSRCESQPPPNDTNLSRSRGIRRPLFIQYVHPAEKRSTCSFGSALVPVRTSCVERTGTGSTYYSTLLSIDSFPRSHVHTPCLSRSHIVTGREIAIVITAEVFLFCYKTFRPPRQSRDDPNSLSRSDGCTLAEPTSFSFSNAH